MSARLKFRGWKLYATAVASFACGSVITAHLTHVQEVKADSNRVFELMVYHTEPGKVPSLESIFKDVSKLQAKHGLNTIGYWVPNDDSPAWKDTFVYLIAHSSQDDAKKTGMHCTPTRHFSLTEMRLCLDRKSEWSVPRGRSVHASDGLLRNKVEKLVGETLHSTASPQGPPPIHPISVNA